LRGGRRRIGCRRRSRRLRARDQQCSKSDCNNALEAHACPRRCGDDAMVGLCDSRPQRTNDYSARGTLNYRNGRRDKLSAHRLGRWRKRTICVDLAACRRADASAYVNARKNSRISCASAAGCSSAAKWPPFGITLQRRMLKTRSAAARGGRRISRGNSQ